MISGGGVSDLAFLAGRSSLTNTLLSTRDVLTCVLFVTDIELANAQVEGVGSPGGARN